MKQQFKGKLWLHKCLIVLRLRLKKYNHSILDMKCEVEITFFTRHRLIKSNILRKQCLILKAVPLWRQEFKDNYFFEKWKIKNFLPKSQPILIDFHQKLNSVDDLCHEGPVSEFRIEHEDDKVAKSSREDRVSGKPHVLGTALNSQRDAVPALVDGVVGRVVEAKRVQQTA